MRRVLLALVLMAGVVRCTPLERAPEGANAGGPDDGGDADRGSDADVDVDGGPSDAGAVVSDAASGSPCDGPCPPETIVQPSGFGTIGAIAVDDANVYFRAEGTGEVLACPKTGCTSAPTPFGTGFTLHIVALGGFVYWSDFSAGKLWRCAAAGCGGSPTAIASNQSSIRGVWTDGVDLFWTAGNDIRRCTPGNCSPTTVLTGVGDVNALAVDQGKVFWFDPSSSSSNFYTSATTAPASQVLFSQGDAYPFAYAGDVFWQKDRALVACSATGCASGPRTIAQVASTAVSPVSDGTRVYFLDRYASKVNYCPVAGCAGAQNVLASGGFLTDRNAIALDALYVYWSGGSTVRRLRR